MSAMATLRELRHADNGVRVGGGASGQERTLPKRMRTALLGLRGRFGAVRLPMYVSAFETEHLATLTEWGDCHPAHEQRYGGH